MPSRGYRAARQAALRNSATHYKVLTAFPECSAQNEGNKWQAISKSQKSPSQNSIIDGLWAWDGMYAVHAECELVYWAADKWCLIDTAEMTGLWSPSYMYPLAMRARDQVK